MRLLSAMPSITPQAQLGHSMSATVNLDAFKALPYSMDYIHLFFFKPSNSDMNFCKWDIDLSGAWSLEIWHQKSGPCL